MNTNWLKWIRRCIKAFLKYCKYKISENKTLDYLKKLQKKYNHETYRKKFYQIRKFLDWLKMPYADDLQPPRQRHNNSIKFWHKEDIQAAHEQLSQMTTKRYTAALLLAATSGIRPFELYNLTVKDIDLEHRTVYIMRSKTGNSRIAFFNDEAKHELREYLKEYKASKNHKELFNSNNLINTFSPTDVRVKDLRKFFSQEWDRKRGPTSIKKILMGHSLRGDVDLMHYNCQSEEDLKRIYDEVGVIVGV